jgi:hypothetical protein
VKKEHIRGKTYLEKSSNYITRFYNSHEMMELLRISASTFYTKLNRKVIFPFKFGKTNNKMGRSFYTDIDVIKCIDFLYPHITKEQRQAILGRMIKDLKQGGYKL